MSTALAAASASCKESPGISATTTTTAGCTSVPSIAAVIEVPRARSPRSCSGARRPESGRRPSPVAPRSRGELRLAKPGGAKYNQDGVWTTGAGSSISHEGFRLLFRIAEEGPIPARSEVLAFIWRSETRDQTAERAILLLRSNQGKIPGGTHVPRPSRPATHRGSELMSVTRA